MAVVFTWIAVKKKKIVQNSVIIRYLHQQVVQPINCQCSRDQKSEVKPLEII